MAGNPPLLLAVLHTGSFIEDDDVCCNTLQDYLGLWSHKPLDTNKIPGYDGPECISEHIYSLPRRENTDRYWGWSDPVLYWHDEKWKTGTIYNAHPDADSFGADIHVFEVPDVLNPYSSSYEVGGLTFVWHPSEEQQLQAKEEGWKAGEEEAKREGMKDGLSLLFDEVDELKLKRKLDPAEAALEKFKAWDSDGDGMISKEELRGVFRSLDPDKFTDEIVDAMLEAADVNKDGSLSYQEFLDWIFEEE